MVPGGKKSVAAAKPKDDASILRPDQQVSVSEPEAEAVAGVEGLSFMEDYGEDVERTGGEYEDDRNFSRPAKRKAGKRRAGKSSSLPKGKMLLGGLGVVVLIQIVLGTLYIGNGDIPLINRLIMSTVFAVLQITPIVCAVSLWKLFSKAGFPGWMAFIPILNVCKMIEIAGLPGWWLLLLFIPGINIYAGVQVIFGVAEAFGRGILFGLGMIVMPFIFYPILAFSND